MYYAEKKIHKCDLMSPAKSYSPQNAKCLLVAGLKYPEIHAGSKCDDNEAGLASTSG